MKSNFKTVSLSFGVVSCYSLQGYKNLVSCSVHFGICAFSQVVTRTYLKSQDLDTWIAKALILID
jgi:hypothetical protein